MKMDDKDCCITTDRSAQTEMTALHFNSPTGNVFIGGQAPYFCLPPIRGSASRNSGAPLLVGALDVPGLHYDGTQETVDDYLGRVEDVYLEEDCSQLDSALERRHTELEERQAAIDVQNRRIERLMKKTHQVFQDNEMMTGEVRRARADRKRYEREAISMRRKNRARYIETLECEADSMELKVKVMKLQKNIRSIYRLNGAFDSQEEVRDYLDLKAEEARKEKATADYLAMDAENAKEMYEDLKEERKREEKWTKKPLRKPFPPPRPTRRQSRLPPSPPARQVKNGRRVSLPPLK